MNGRNENHIWEEFTSRAEAYYAGEAPFGEKYRLAYHISPPVAWLNDPNGLVYHDGVYHLYYQYSAPFFENCVWAHATTRDFLHYRYEPIALYPSEGEGMWSGSAVVDSRNVSGLFDDKGGILAFYTRFQIAESHQRVELAYSPDGMLFRRYAGNPIIGNEERIWDFRDPKTFWHEETGRWITVVAGGVVRIFSSPDLLHWTFESDCPDIQTECPDLFPLAVDGDPERQKWVLSLGGRAYIVGAFDGKRFIPESEPIPMNGGTDCYATQTFSDIPAQDGRRIAVSWMDCWDNVNRPFQSLSLPVALTLRTNPQGQVRLYQQPIAEMRGLRGEAWEAPRQTLREGERLICPLRTELCEIHVEASAACGEVRLHVLQSGEESTVIGCRPATGEVFVDRRRAGKNEYTAKCPDVFTAMVTPGESVHIEAWVDRGSVEVFFNDGEQAFAALVYPLGEEGGITLEAVGGDADIRRMEVHRLRPITWEKGDLQRKPVE